MISTITNSISKAANYFMPEEGKPVSLKTHAVAIAVIATAAAFDPFLAVQLGTTYALGAATWNAAQQQEPLAIREQLEQRPVQQPAAQPDPQGEILLGDEHEMTPLQRIYANPDLTETEKMQLAQQYI